MFCIYCGKQISEDNDCCPECGAAIEETEQDSVKVSTEKVEFNDSAARLDNRIIEPTEEKAQSEKKKKHKRPILLLLLAVLVGIFIFNVFGRKTIELSELLGQPIDQWEDALKCELDVFDDGVYYLKKGNTYYLECVADKNSNVVAVVLLNTEKSKYSIWGVENGMSAWDSEKLLSDAGMICIHNRLWQCPNGTDAFYLTNEGHWVFEKNSEYLKEEVLRIKSEEAFNYRFPESIGSVYLGEGRILEYCHDSFAAFVHQYEEKTGYSQEEFIEKYDYQYVLVAGEVSDVSADGIVYVDCIDNEASVAAGLIWPMMGTAGIELVYEQQGELENIKRGDQIVAYGKIDMYSYNWLDYPTFRLTLGILTLVNNNPIQVPELYNSPYGITVYREASNSSENVHESEQEYSAADLIGLSMNEISQIYGNQYSTYYPDGDPPYFYYETGCPYVFFSYAMNGENSIISEIRGNEGAEIANGVCIGDSLDKVNLTFADCPNFLYSDTISNYGYFQDVSFDLENCSICIYLEDSVVTGFQCFRK